MGVMNRLASFLRNKANAGCRECLPGWEIQPRARVDHDRDPEDSDAEFCPRGQNRAAASC